MKWLYSFCLILFLFSCSKGGSFGRLKSVSESNELVVLTRYSSTTYLKSDDTQVSGFEYDLVRAFASDMGWNVRFIVKDSVQEVLEDLADRRAHMAASGVTITQNRKERFEFSRSYQTVYQQVVCGKPHKVKSKSDLNKLNLLVVDGTSYEESLKKLKESFSELEFKIHQETSEETLEMIWENRNLCTVIDSNIVKVHRRYFPELRVVYEFPEKQSLAWAFSSVDDSLKKKADQWLAGKGKVHVNDLKNKYYGHVKEFDYYDTKKFLERIKTRLPSYQKLFRKAAQENHFSWMFLAAVAYQESHWDPNAVSPTGVRGIMMLTRNTAREMNVQDRTDPEQSIFGGARYLRKQLKRLPSYVWKRHKKWFALASYNVGFYHLRDAMALAVLQNKNPGSWVHVRQVLPLLSKRKYYKNLRYGYARGLEPVIYVSRIRNYYDLLRNAYPNK